MSDHKPCKTCTAREGDKMALPATDHLFLVPERFGGKGGDRGLRSGEVTVRPVLATRSIVIPKADLNYSGGVLLPSDGSRDLGETSPRWRGHVSVRSQFGPQSHGVYSEDKCLPLCKLSILDAWNVKLTGDRHTDRKLRGMLVASGAQSEAPNQYDNIANWQKKYISSDQRVSCETLAVGAFLSRFCSSGDADDCCKYFAPLKDAMDSDAPERAFIFTLACTAASNGDEEPAYTEHAMILTDIVCLAGTPPVCCLWFYGPQENRDTCWCIDGMPLGPAGDRGLVGTLTQSGFGEDFSFGTAELLDVTIERRG